MLTGFMPTTPGPRRWRREVIGTRSRNLRAVQSRKPFGFGKIIRRIGIEEWIERLGRPARRRNPITRGPAINLVDVLDRERVAKFLAQRNSPKSDDRMRPPAGSRDRKLRIRADPRLMQARNEVARQKRTVRCHAHHPGGIRPVHRHPVEAGENSGQRPGKAGHRIGDHGKSKMRKPRWLAVGVENEAAALRIKPCDDALENGLAGDGAHRLVTTANPPRKPAGEQDSRDSWFDLHHVESLA